MKRKITTKNLTLFTLLVAGGMFLFSCESEPTTQQTTPKQHETTKKETPIKRQKVKKIFFAIPSPVEMASLIKSSDSKYQSDLLNSIDNAKNYTDYKSQALNLGIYFSDITYSSIFERTQESISYLSTIKTMAEDLGIADAIDKDMYKRLEENKENRDSLLTIFSETYWNLNAYLKEEKREEIAAMIIAGGWFEGLYLAVNHADNNEAIKQRIGEQKYTLKDLNTLINSYESSKVSGIKKDLKEMSQIYSKIIIEKSATKTVSKDGVMELDNNSKLIMSEETLKQIKDKVTSIRNSYVQK